MPRTPQIPPSDIYLMDAATNAGFFISVKCEGETLANTKHDSRSKIEKVLGDVDEATLVFRDSDGKLQGWGHIVYDYGQRNEEIIADMSTGWVENVMNEYYKKYVHL